MIHVEQKMAGGSAAFSLRRRAFTLLEVTIAAAMLAMLMASAVQMIRLVSVHQRAAERRAAGLEAVQAVVDEISNMPWEKLTAQAAEQVTVPKPLQSYLPAAQLTVALEDQTAPVTSKRVHVELTWKGGDGQPVAPTRLTAWVYPDRAPAR